MECKIVVPKMGMSTVEVDLTYWHVKKGDAVNTGDPLADVESEKANHTIESEVSGTVKDICYDADTTVEVGTVICIIETDE